MNVLPWNSIRNMMSPTRTISGNLKLFVLLVLCASRSQCSSRGHFDSERQDGGVTKRTNNALESPPVSEFDCNDDSGDCPITRHERRRHFRTEDEDDRPGKWLSKNFIMTDSLPDGEKEVRIHFNGITAKETSVVTNGTGLVLRQFTDGRHFMQTILMADGNLQDCEYVDQKSAIKDFIRIFRKEIRGNSHVSPKSSRRKHNAIDKKHNTNERMSNVEMKQVADQLAKRLRQQHVKAHDRPGYSDNSEIKNYSELENYDEMLSKLNSVGRGEGEEGFEGWGDEDMVFTLGPNHTRRTKRQKWRARNRRRVSHTENGLWNVTVEELESQLPEDVSEWLDFDKTKLQCDKIHEQLKKEHGVMNHHDDIQKRSPRVVRSTVLIPGTRWCGKGNSGIQHNHLGEFAATDRCCRKHDNACPFWIEAMENKYGMFNWRPNTLMHCRCDERFRTCLKLADSDVANMVGRIFFNVVQTKCFVLKPMKVCLERSWWGKCLKVGYSKQAHLRDNLPY
ncbi:uncharacterized protein LOC143914189 isoform X2 [Arctopsyche grandis]|uniref:uncharacterized protein LOC143914189 isoform X2 n=1 Tax=Arctopsyche grandis TaxID=121162 RepID=UPI00406D6964